MGHAPICQIRRCPERTYGRVLTGDQKRLDLCEEHYRRTLLYKGNEPIEIFGDRDEK